MCRLFGFRSVIQSRVHRSLLVAENALGTQSSQHPDGWGVAYYVDGAPHLVRSAATAMGDAMFHRLSAVVSSETVVAHVRKATQGEKTTLNCHPFQHGRWVFAHNGDIPEFERFRALLLDEVSPEMRHFILGETDSEVIFFILLSVLKKRAPLSEPRSAQELAAAVRETTLRVRDVCSASARELLLTFVVTNGETLVASQGGKELYLSTYKTRCADRDACPRLSPECEAPSATGKVNHCIVSSEPLMGENVWEPLALGGIVGVDRAMQVHRMSIERCPLPVVA
jgi:predicted glutamine amidotransferase